MRAIAIAMALMLALTSSAGAQNGEGEGETESEPSEGEGETQSDPIELELDIERLDEWLALHAARGDEARLVSGGLAIALGAIELPVEAVILATMAPHPNDATTPVLGAVGITFAVLDLAYGIYKLALPSVQEERLACRRAVRARGDDRRA